jgi:hypothetical protein
MPKYSKSVEVNQSRWQLLGTIATIESPWVTVKCERWQDDENRELEYWRVKRPDSVIVIPIHDGHFLLPHPIFRPGVDEFTWDFPGGRLQDAFSHEEMARQLLEKELSISYHEIYTISPINTDGYIVDSSFSSQRVWGYLAKLDSDALVKENAIGWRVPVNKEGSEELLKRLKCLQCRVLLLELLSSREEI